MSQSITITVGDKKFERDLDGAEVTLLSKAANAKDAQTALSLIFDGGCREASVASLLSAVNICLKLSGEISFPPIYSFTGCMDGETAFLGARGIGGIRIGDDLFSIRGGIDRCVLRKVGITTDGRGKTVEETDIRHLRFLDTTNMGKIRINRRKRPARVIRILHKIESLLSNLNGQSVVTIDVG